MDAHGVSCNPSPSDEELTRARWHGDYDQDAIAYLTLFLSDVVEVLIQSLDDEINRRQDIVDI